MTIYSFNSYKRTIVNKNNNNKLRGDNKVPGVIYCKNYNQSIYVDQVNCQTIKVILTTEKNLFHCTLEDETFLVVVKDIKNHPTKLYATHIDLQKVELNDKIKVKVSLKFTDEKRHSTGVSIIKHIDSIVIKTSVKDIPSCITVDLSHLTSNKSIFLKDIIFPQNITVPIMMKQENLNLLIASVSSQKVIAEKKIIKDK